MQQLEHTRKEQQAIADSSTATRAQKAEADLVFLQAHWEHSDLSKLQDVLIDLGEIPPAMFIIAPF